MVLCRSGVGQRSYLPLTGGSFPPQWAVLAGWFSDRCEGPWIIDGDEFDLNMGTVSMLSSRPLSLVVWSLADGRYLVIQVMNFQLLHRLVYTDVFSVNTACALRESLLGPAILRR